MKNVFAFLKKTFYNTAAIYSVTTLVFILGFYLSSEENAANYGAVRIFLYSLFFGLCAALVLSVFGLFKKMPSLLRYSLEFILIYALFYFFIFYLTGNYKNFPAFFAFSILFVLIYAAAGAINLGFAGREAEKKSAEEYRALFDETQNAKK